MEENEVKTRKNRHAETNKKGGILKVLVIAVIFVILVAISTVIWYNICLSAIGSAEDKVSLEIPLGSGTNKIATVLKNNGMIRSELAFKLYVKLNNISDFQAGKYELTKDMNVVDIVKTLQTGKLFKDNQLKITFVEGKTFRYFANEIAKNTNNTEEAVYELLEDEEYIDSLINEYWFLTDTIKDENIYYPLEGYLFPDTYSFENKEVTIQEIFKTLLDQTAKILEPYKVKIEKGKYNVHEILTIASIAENEAIFDKDRKDVTSVLYNRLNKNMSLGSDVTTYYAFKIDLGSRDLYKKEINTYNPYNTRGPNMLGKLPIGPICSVSKASIEAAVNPNHTENLFFVADASGKIYFTKSNEEHQKIIDDLKATGAWYNFDK